MSVKINVHQILLSLLLCCAAPFPTLPALQEKDLRMLPYVSKMYDLTFFITNWPQTVFQVPTMRQSIEWMLFLKNGDNCLTHICITID